MTEYEYIIQEVKRAHYSGWNDGELIRRTSGGLKEKEKDDKREKVDDDERGKTKA